MTSEAQVIFGYEGEIMESILMSDEGDPSTANKRYIQQALDEANKEYDDTSFLYIIEERLAAFVSEDNFLVFVIRI